MGKRLDNEDRDILNFRPNIEYIEPEQQPGVIEGTDRPQLEDVQEERDKIKRLANAVNVLAGAVQARVDSKAEDMFIKLDPSVDQDTVQAMKRRFPGADTTRITYAQYRECKDGIRLKGEEIGKQAIITPEQVADARDDLYSSGIIGSPGRLGPSGSSLRPTGLKSKDLSDPGLGTGKAGTGSNDDPTTGEDTGDDRTGGDNEDSNGGGNDGGYIPGGFEGPDAGSGGFRPELNTSGQILQPLNVEEISVSLICILVNYIWKNYIKEILIKLPFPVGPPMNLLPDELCDPGFDFEIQGLLLLGEKPDDLLNGSAAGEAIQELIEEVKDIEV